MKVSTNCDLCQFQKFCPMLSKHQRLPLDDGGLGLCPKLPEMKLLRCRNCLFCHMSDGIENGHPVYNCAAMHYNRIQLDGKIPKTTPRDCPIKETKRKGL